MGIGYNPKIVTNGLVLCFDAGNRKCRTANTEYIFKDLVPGQTFTRLSLGDGVVYNARYNNQGAVVLANQGNNVPNFAAPAYLNFGANAYTVIVWQTTENSNTSTAGIISSANTFNSTPNFWGIERTNGTSLFRSRSGSGTLNFPAYTVNTFHCYAYTRSGTSMVNYFDGVQANTGTSATDPNDMVANNAYIFFGAPSRSDYIANANIVNQRIGWTGIYNRALSAAEIKQNYDALKSRYLTLNTSYTTESYNVAGGGGGGGGGGGAYMTVTTVGATETTDGNYKVATFNDSGSFTVTALGSDPTEGSKVNYLVVAGGGGGGASSDESYQFSQGFAPGGGGGAGGLKSANGTTVAAQTYTVTVGGGGAGSSTNGNKGTNGSTSSFGSISSTTGGGAGGGGTFSANGNENGQNGGSGGGAGAWVGTIGTGISGEGNNGGSFYADDAFGGSWAGGGGGAGSAGDSGGLGNAGPGGLGLVRTITGSSVTYAAGGGGGGGSGGTGGGGSAGAFAGPGTNGATNLGGGGGGGAYEEGAVNNGGNGGKGVVIIRWRFQ